MKKYYLLFPVLILFGTCTPGLKHGQKKDCAIMPVHPEHITLTDNFLQPVVKRNAKITIPYAFRKCEETGRIENFAVAAGISQQKHKGERYNDTDVFKIIEGAAGLLAAHPDPLLEEYVDSLIKLIGKAQEEDGYLFTSRSADPENPTPGAGEDRWTDVWISHELYNAGHLYEAAVAYYRVTGKDNLLKIALKNADLVCEIFGWGKKEIAPGHPEIEIGLIRLFEVTGDEKYLNQTHFFLDVRGKPQEHPLHPEGTRFAIYNNKTYLQQHLPILEQPEAVGHAVRAGYMYTAMTELAKHLPGCSAYHEKSEEIWSDVVGRKIYLTGGTGAQPKGESFGPAFYLPNATAYNETCAAIANVFWNYSLFLSTGESKYIDVLERTLFNGLLSGISQDGTNFFYPNPLSSKGKYERSPWFGVACCPGNLCRFIPRASQYIYARSKDEIFVNLFIASKADIPLQSGSVSLVQNSNYPWEEGSSITLSTDKNILFTLKIRVPAWLGNSPFEGDLYHYADTNSYTPEISVNGKAVELILEKGYACIYRKWKDGDVVDIKFTMPVRKVLANEKVKADSGRVALERGPIVFCLEEIDNGSVLDLELEAEFETEYRFDPAFFDGNGKLILSDANHTLTAIPYYLWANREPGEMEVWLKVKTQ